MSARITFVAVVDVADDDEVEPVREWFEACFTDSGEDCTFTALVQTPIPAEDQWLGGDRAIRAV